MGKRVARIAIVLVAIVAAVALCVASWSNPQQTVVSLNVVVEGGDGVGMRIPVEVTQYPSVRFTRVTSDADKTCYLDEGGELAVPAGTRYVTPVGYAASADGIVYRTSVRTQASSEVGSIDVGGEGDPASWGSIVCTATNMGGISDDEIDTIVEQLGTDDYREAIIAQRDAARETKDVSEDGGSIVESIEFGDTDDKADGADSGGKGDSTKDEHNLGDRLTFPTMGK